MTATQRTLSEAARIRTVDKPQELPYGPRLVITSKERPEDAKAAVAGWLKLYGKLVMWRQSTWGTLYFCPDNGKEGE